MIFKFNLYPFFKVPFNCLSRFNCAECILRVQYRHLDVIIQIELPNCKQHHLNEAKSL